MNLIQNIENYYIRMIMAGMLGILAYFYGNLDALMLAMLSIMLLDFIGNITKDIYLKNINSKSMFKIIAKKMGILCIVAVANIIDSILEVAGVLRSLSIAYFIAHEGISIIENWGAMGLPVPKKLKSILLQLKDEDTLDK